MMSIFGSSLKSALKPALTAIAGAMMVIRIKLSSF
jgi:hypothetical protein